MIKCFLSHSSKDKQKYVVHVVKALRKENVIYDEAVFEAGMDTAEEIVNGLDETSLFVLFLSDSALESDWVKSELSLAKDRLDEGKLDRIYPFIIEKHISHLDSRIPNWMKEKINLQHIEQPKVAARKINARLREISWQNHPTLKAREQIFVGRNEQINNVESRFDDFNQIAPIVFVASGLTHIGRKSFIKQSLQKANMIKPSYEFPLISLDANDSIEDFILKINDLGFSEQIQKLDLLKTSLHEKISIATQLARALAQEKERILIEDRGSIILYDGEIVDWFHEVVEGISEFQHLSFCIASRFRANRNIAFKHAEYYFEEIPELDKTERNGLLVRYSKFKELELCRNDLDFFADLLTGYPEQTIFAVDTISDSSVFEAKRSSHLIQEYATNKARVVVDSLKNDEKSLHFLYFLSRFEFISFEFLFELVEEQIYFPILSSFLLSSICERLGTTGDYIRVSEVIRDFVDRSRFGMPIEFKDKLDQHVREFVENYTDENRDVSDYIFSIQQALITGKNIPEKLLIPSYFLKTIKSLYDKGGSNNYKEVIKLADRVLLNEKYLHQNLIDHVYYLKCQALARLRDSEFFGVVKKVKEPGSSFLHGFYYRISGNQEKAINSFKRVLEHRPNDYRAKSELVLVYMQSDEHELAYDLAKEVYYNSTSNPLNANNFLSCIFHQDKTPENRILVQEITDKLKTDPSDRAQEIHSSAKAKILALFDNDYISAFALLEETINTYPDVTYPILTMADLAIKSKDLDKLRLAIKLLDNNESKNSQTYRTYIRNKAIYLALCGQLSEAIELVKKELRGVREKAMNELIKKLSSFS